MGFRVPVVARGKDLLFRPAGAAQEGFYRHRRSLRLHLAHVGRRAGHGGKIGVHGVHAVKKSRGKVQHVSGAVRRPHPRRKQGFHCGKAQSRVGLPVGLGGLDGEVRPRLPEGRKIFSRGADHHRLRPAGDGIVGGAAGKVGHTALPPVQKARQRLDGVEPSPVDIVSRMSAGAAGDLQLYALSAGAGKGLHRPLIRLPPSSGGAGNGPAIVEAVGVQKAPGPFQPRGRHLCRTGKAHFLRHRKEQAEGTVGDALFQKPQHHRVAQVVVRPQRGAPVGVEKTVGHLEHRRVGERVKAAVRPDGAHHVHMSLQNQQRAVFHARRGGHLGHQIACLVPHRRKAHAGEQVH